MDRDYGIFERLPDGSLMWREFVRGLENARAKLQGLAKRPSNEFFAIDTPSKTIVARVNAGGA